MGLRLYEISKNMFLNDFLYDVLGEVVGNQNKSVTRDYFKLYDTTGIEDTSAEKNNMVAVIMSEGVDLNNLFMPTVEKNIFYESAKGMHNL